MENKNSNQNRNTKDSVFVDYFAGDERIGKQNFLSLFNALHGTNLTLENTRLERFSLDKTLYQKQFNDISMLVNGKLIVLIEHQSTINPNLPLRLLMYVSRLYEKIVKGDDRYRGKLIKIPLPEFYVFYNGERAYDSEKTLRLSDAFEECKITQEKGVEFMPSNLDLSVKVININSSAHHEILRNCKPIREYTRFIELTNEERKANPDSFLERAINRAISEGILAGYLEPKASEVRNMLMVDYDYETDIRVKQMEAREDGARENAEKTAINCLKLGKLVIEDISTVTGLPLERVAELAQSIKK